MDPNPNEIILDLFPYLKVYKDGTIERVAGYETVPPGLDPETSVFSEDIIIDHQTSLSVRLYRPNTVQPDEKLPLIIYFHGGAFCIASPAEPKYHGSLNKIVAAGNIIAVSVDYRLVPEFPLSAVYDDSWAALEWIASKISDNNENKGLLHNNVDFERVFLVGDSSGANIAHHLALKIKETDPGHGLRIQGIGMIHPYFWGENPIGSEVTDKFRKEMVDGWWKFVCKSDKGCDDPLINPFCDGAPSLDGLGCEEVLVLVAGMDILRDRGRVYYENLVKSGWNGKAEFVETENKDHVFHIFDPDSVEANHLIQSLASFINKNKNLVS